jgi:N-acyl-D-aspartate/D-glutamate deacylase
VSERTLIRNGRIVDGLKSPAVMGNVLIEGERIVGIGSDLGPADEVLDAEGAIVVPAFVDIHSHSDYTLLMDPRAESAIRQGVATEVVGNCGFGCFPVSRPEIARNAVYGYREGFDHFFSHAGEYYDAIDAVQPAVNVATLVPNGQLRMDAGGMKATPLTRDERAHAVNQLNRSMDAGAWGFSTGLEYPAERGADEDEICAFCKATARFGGIYATHTRYRDSKSATAVMEAIRTARRASISLEISHLLPRNFSEEGLACLACADHAIEAGDPLHFDMHTRCYGITTLAAALSPRLLQLRPEALAAELATRAGIQEARAYKSMFSEANWDKIVLFDSDVFPEFGRRVFTDIAAELQTDGHGAMLELIRRAPRAMREHYVLRPMYEETDLFTAFGHARCMPGSDATSLTQDGPLAGSFFHGAYSWAAWYVSRCALETSLLSIEEAIHRITALPCAKLGIPRRGSLSAGNFADVLVFEPDAFRDRTSTYEPNTVATGVRHLLVNGTITIRDHDITSLRGGRALRRVGAMIV